MTDREGIQPRPVAPEDVAEIRARAYAEVLKIVQRARDEAFASAVGKPFSRESAGWTMACYIHDRIDHATRVCNTLAREAIEAAAAKGRKP